MADAAGVVHGDNGDEVRLRKVFFTGEEQVARLITPRMRTWASDRSFDETMNKGQINIWAREMKIKDFMYADIRGTPNIELFLSGEDGGCGDSDDDDLNGGGCGDDSVEEHADVEELEYGLIAKSVVHNDGKYIRFLLRQSSEQVTLVVIESSLASISAIQFIDCH